MLRVLPIAPSPHTLSLGQETKFHIYKIRDKDTELPIYFVILSYKTVELKFC